MNAIIKLQCVAFFLLCPSLLFSQSEPKNEKATLNKVQESDENRGYLTINNKSWDQILSEETFTWKPPYTVHLPIQPVHSPDYIHLDCALNAIHRPVYQDVLFADYKKTANRETFIVQFAFDDPPFVPDFNLGKLYLADNKYPVVTGKYMADGISYQIEYSCSMVDTNQNLLWIQIKVKNEKNFDAETHVRTKINCQLEGDLFDYHYVPYSYDARKWLPCNRISLEQNSIMKDKLMIGKVISESMILNWEKEVHFGNGDFDKKYSTGSSSVSEKLRLKDLQDVIHARATLKPGEEKSFSIALLTNQEKISSSQLAYLKNSTAVDSRKNALDNFKTQITSDNSSLTFQTNNWQDIFTSLQISTLQLLLKFPDKEYFMPTQGSSSERFFVWVWEAAQMLRPMLRLGHFESVRKSLDYIFSLQDGGFPPEGKFTTLDGSIGTTGPKWICTTGAALALASDYYLYSGDRDFLNQYLPKIIKASKWIIGELRATRKLNPDGSRPLYYGLMPFGVGTDGDIGYIVSMSDAYTFWGLEKAVVLLEEINASEAKEFRKELESYRSDLANTIKGLSHPDGFIERKIPSNETGTNYYSGFDNVCSAAQLAYAGAIDPDSELFGRFISFYEKNRVVDYFMGNIDKNIAYLGIAERDWQYIYLTKGEWKKAFAANCANLKYGITQDAHQVQERFARNDPGYNPWQPNGSGNGRILEMMLNSFYFDKDNRVTLLGGIPFAWLQKNKMTLLNKLYVPHGYVNIKVEAKSADKCLITVTSSNKNVLPATIRLPEYFHATSDNPSVADSGNGFFKLLAPMEKIEFTISSN